MKNLKPGEPPEILELELSDWDRLLNKAGDTRAFRPPLLNQPGVHEMRATGDPIRASLKNEEDKEVYDEIMAGYIAEVGNLDGPYRLMMRRAAVYEILLAKAILGESPADSIDVWEKLLQRIRKSLGIDKPPVQRRGGAKSIMEVLAVAVGKVSQQPQEPQPQGRLIEQPPSKPAPPTAGFDVGGLMKSLASKVAAAPDKVPEKEKEEWEDLF